MANVKPQISLQKISLKNFIVYRKQKRTPKQSKWQKKKKTLEKYLK